MVSRARGRWPTSKSSPSLVTIKHLCTSARQNVLMRPAVNTNSTQRVHQPFVWAVGPWMGKTFPDILGKKTSVPMGYVVYFATPVNDQGSRSESSELHFPGVTGWAALPVDNRGFRVRGAERAPGAPAGPPRIRQRAARISSGSSSGHRSAGHGAPICCFPITWPTLRIAQRRTECWPCHWLRRLLRR